MMSSAKISILTQATTSGARFFLGLILARELGPEAFGLYTMLWLAVLFLNSIHTSFITQPLMSIGSQKNNIANNRYIKLTVLHQLIFLLILIPCLLVFFFGIDYFIGDVAWQVMALATLYAIGYYLYELIRKILFLEKRIGRVFILDSLVNGISLCFVLLYASYYELTIANYFLLLLFPVCLAVVLEYRIFVKLAEVGKDYFIKKTRESYFFGAPLFHTALTQFFSSQITLYIAALIIGVAAAGEIGAARNILGLLFVLFMAFENFMPIQANYAYEKGINSLNKYFINSFIKFGTPIILICVAIFFFSKEIVVFVYGVDYLYASELVRWFVVIHMLMFVNRLLTIYCRTLALGAAIKLGGVMSLVMSLALSYPLIFYFNYEGAMLIMLMQQILILLPMLKKFNQNGIVKI